MNKIPSMIAYAGLASLSLLDSSCCTILGMGEGIGNFAYCTGCGMYEDGVNAYRYINKQLSGSGSGDVKTSSGTGMSGLENIFSPSCSDGNCSK